jgi:hypothetical protein
MVLTGGALPRKAFVAFMAVRAVSGQVELFFTCSSRFLFVMGPADCRVVGLLLRSPRCSMESQEEFLSIPLPWLMARKEP